MYLLSIYYVLGPFEALGLHWAEISLFPLAVCMPAGAGLSGTIPGTEKYSIHFGSIERNSVFGLKNFNTDKKLFFLAVTSSKILRFPLDECSAYLFICFLCSDGSPLSACIKNYGKEGGISTLSCLAWGETWKIRVDWKGGHGGLFSRRQKAFRNPSLQLPIPVYRLGRKVFWNSATYLCQGVFI